MWVMTLKLVFDLAQNSGRPVFNHPFLPSPHSVYSSQNETYFRVGSVRVHFPSALALGEASSSSWIFHREVLKSSWIIVSWIIGREALPSSAADWGAAAAHSCSGRLAKCFGTQQKECAESSRKLASTGWLGAFISKGPSDAGKIELRSTIDGELLSISLSDLSAVLNSAPPWSVARNAGGTLAARWGHASCPSFFFRAHVLCRVSADSFLSHADSDYVSGNGSHATARNARAARTISSRAMRAVLLTGRAAAWGCSPTSPRAHWIGPENKYMPEGTRGV